MTLKIPAAFAAAPATKTQAKAKPIRGNSSSCDRIDELGLFPKDKVHARIDMSAEVAGAGLCPECRRPMVRAFANGHPVLVCDDHRIAIPVADQAGDGA